MKVGKNGTPPPAGPKPRWGLGVGPAPPAREKPQLAIEMQTSERKQKSSSASKTPDVMWWRPGVAECPSIQPHFSHPGATSPLELVSRGENHRMLKQQPRATRNKTEKNRKGWLVEGWWRRRRPTHRGGSTHTIKISTESANDATVLLIGSCTKLHSFHSFQNIHFCNTLSAQLQVPWYGDFIQWLNSLG